MEFISNYVIFRPPGSDPLYYLRGILFSGRGSLMELGFTPTLTADYMLHMATGLGAIKIDFSIHEDVELYRTMSKSKYILI